MNCLRNKIKRYIKTSSCKLGQTLANSALLSTENKLSQLTSKLNKMKLENITKGMGALDGNFCQNNFWKIKNQVLLRSTDPPIAMRDKKGNLVTSPMALKQLYLETYIERLRPAKMSQDFNDIFQMKAELWRRRNELMKMKKTEPWNYSQFEASLNRLKSKKSRDPHGMIGEIFKHEYSGQDLRNALLLCFNKVKKEMVIPEFMTLSDITSIYKRSGSKQEMDNQRGIFNLTIFKKLMDYLLFEEMYDGIDAVISDSNIGGRKERMAKDHLFVAYGFINSVKNDDDESIEIQIFDV